MGRLGSARLVSIDLRCVNPSLKSRYHLLCGFLRRRVAFVGALYEWLQATLDFIPGQSRIREH